MTVDLTASVALCVTVIAGCWLASVVTGEHSWVDRLWSVLPPVYAWIWAAEAVRSGPHAERAVLMALLATAWGARLTFNFWRKGGYAPGGEDYRWGILRARIPGWAWPWFNLGFVAGYQNALVWAFTLSAAVAAAHPSPLGPVDAALAVVFLGCLTGETIADQQQWRFQQAKRAALSAGAPHDPFLTEGLFRYSRHPNFFFEQAQWWVFAAFPVVAGAGWLHPGLIGPVLLTALFDGSTRFTEAITRSRYPSYAAYQRTTSRQIPWLPGRR